MIKPNEVSLIKPFHYYILRKMGPSDVFILKDYYILTTMSKLGQGLNHYFIYIQIQIHYQFRIGTQESILIPSTHYSN